MKSLEERVKDKSEAIKPLLPLAVPVKPSSDGLANLAEWKLLNRQAMSVRVFNEGFNKGWGKWGK